MAGKLLLFLVLFSFHGCSLQSGKDGQAAIEDPIFRIDVFKARDLEYECFRIPSLLFTSKGTLLAFAEGRGQHSNSCADHGDVHIVLKRSTDYGHTWSNVSVIYTEYPHNTIGNPAAVEDASTGKIILAFCRNNKNILTMESSDDGLTWGNMVDISEMVVLPAWGFIGTGPPGGIQLPSGRLIICTYASGGGGPGSFAIYSDDGGKSWKRSGYTGNTGTGECQIVALGIQETPPSGHMPLAMTSRTSQGHYMSYSNDSGENWYNLTRTSSLDPQTVCESSLLAIPHQGSFMDTHLYMTQPHSTLRMAMTFFYSVDAGHTWKVGEQLWAGPSAYSSMVYNKLKIYCLYEKGNTGPYETLTLDVFSPLI